MPLDQQNFVLPETKPTIRELPDKLSDLILVALEDLEKAEASPKHIIVMWMWHLPRLGLLDNLCSVCLAGSVMAFSLGANPSTPRTPGDYSHHINNKLLALNSVRGGDISLALETIDPEGRKHYFPQEYMVNYERNPVGFKAQLRSVAKRLAAKGY